MQIVKKEISAFVEDPSDTDSQNEKYTDLENA